MKQTIGQFLATLRKANGYTQEEVAERLNVSNRTLSSWETDRTVPDVLVFLLTGIIDAIAFGLCLIIYYKKNKISNIKNLLEDNLI